MFDNLKTTITDFRLNKTCSRALLFTVSIKTMLKIDARHIRRVWLRVWYVMWITTLQGVVDWCDGYLPGCTRWWWLSLRRSTWLRPSRSPRRNNRTLYSLAQLWMWPKRRYYCVSDTLVQIIECIRTSERVYVYLYKKRHCVFCLY